VTDESHAGNASEIRCAAPLRVRQRTARGQFLPVSFPCLQTAGGAFPVRLAAFPRSGPVFRKAPGVSSENQHEQAFGIHDIRRRRHPCLVSFRPVIRLSAFPYPFCGSDRFSTALRFTGPGRKCPARQGAPRISRESVPLPFPGTRGSTVSSRLKSSTARRITPCGISCRLWPSA
jgi:hypothetical protein